MRHLSEDLIVGALDDELTGAERLEADTHLAVCESCRERMESARRLSVEIEAGVLSTTLPVTGGMRQNIEKALGRQHSPMSFLQSPGLQSPGLQSPAKVMRRFGWGISIAATLALGVLLAPKQGGIPAPLTVDTASSASQVGTMEVDGETFVPVAYSSPDLSTASPHIVQMLVPISSLAEAGISLEPTAGRMVADADPERFALADVLIGADGQPRGVHVLGLE